jgi:LysR family transcriptional regulator, nitrogen assimilation regulatory protein
MHIAQLKTLIHVAELGSLSKAADRLHIAQPALSRQIRLMEKELGVALFERHGRGMVLTEAGREILDHAARVMAELEAIRQSATSGRSSYKGTVMVGTTPTVAEIMIIPLAGRIREAHPQLRLRFSSAFSGHLLDWLQRGDLELAVTYDPQPLRSVRTVPVMIENLLLVGAGSERLELSGAVPFAQLASKELVLPSPPHGLRAAMESCARRAGIELRASIEADSYRVMIDLVRNGFGLTVLPLAPVYSLEHLIQSGELSAAPLVDPTPARKLVLAYPADRPVSPAAQFVGESIVRIAADLVNRKRWAGQMVDRGPR